MECPPVDNLPPSSPSSQAHPIYSAALNYQAAGHSIVPIAPGSKAPSILQPTTGEVIEITWKPYQDKPATETQLRQWFTVDYPVGLGIVAGPVSGAVLDDGTRTALEFVDFDELATFEAYRDLLHARGYSALLEQLPHERTPNGIHVGYLCRQWAGNTKLAQRKIGTKPDGSDDIKTLIETRGQGGQCVVAPTPPGIHPDHPERGYVMVYGSWTEIPVVTPEARDALWECAKALNEYVPHDTTHRETRGQSTHDEQSPGAQFNARVSRDELIALLEKHGWSVVFSRNGTDYLCRPGKEGRAWSATLGYVAPKTLYVFTTNGHPFDAERAYDPFGVYTRLEHGGDFTAAARALADADDTRHHASNSDEQDVSQGDVTLENVIETFREWLDLPDAGFIEVLLATYAANQIPGDPVWLLAVGPSSGGKTEPLQAMLGLPHTKLASTLTESALLSGTPKRDKDKSSTGGLLREIGDFGYLILKDFTSVLAMQDKIRMTTVAALREIYDGSWPRPLGIDGGRVLSWKGKVAILAGCTDVIDSHHVLMTAMGSRFLMYRIPLIDAYAQAAKAYDMTARESEMRHQLRQVVSTFFRGRDFSTLRPTTAEAIRERIIQLSILAVVARSPIERDRHTREITLIPDPEAPARVTKALGKLYAALLAIGVPAPRAWTLIRKIAFDSMPKLRYALLKALAEKSTQAASALAIAIHHPTQTTKRALEDLVGLKLVEREKIPGIRADLWSLTDETTIRIRQLPEIIENDDSDEL